jgi:hypothetical protein
MITENFPEESLGKIKLPSLSVLVKVIIDESAGLSNVTTAYCSFF